MKPQLSDSTKKEIQDYFEKQLLSKDRLYYKADNLLDEMLRACDFVYIADGGSVIHSRKWCGHVPTNMVPFDVAVRFGYTKPCKTCGHGTYVERLLSEII